MGLQSMTGFGKHVFEWLGKRYVTEIKTLNSRQLDISVRLPQDLRPLDQMIRKLAADYLFRGKIEISIYTEFYKEASLPVNDEALRAYILYFKDLSSHFGIQSDPLQAAIRMPDVFIQAPSEYTEEDFASFERQIITCFENVVHHRKSEGSALKSELEKGIKAIERLLLQVEPFEKERITHIRAKLLNNMSSLPEDIKVDPNRLEQELIYYLEKLDITEEKVRLANHLKYFAEIMNSEQHPGRKLNFITQEIGREINTLGSKANHAQIQRIVVEMKDELEKIKEQILNIL